MSQRTIVLAPGEELVIRVVKDPPVLEEIEKRKGVVVLPVRWIGQHGPSAHRSPGDCGPACVAMAIHYLTDQEPTVDQVAEAASQEPGSHYADFAQLAKACRVYGVSPEYVRPLRPKHIAQQIGAGRPVLALVKYDEIKGNQDKQYKDAHFVLVVGYSRDTVIFHDPNRLWGQRFGEFREMPWELFKTALGSTHKLASNRHSDHGMLFDV